MSFKYYFMLIEPYQLINFKCKTLLYAFVIPFVRTKSILSSRPCNPDTTQNIINVFLIQTIMFKDKKVPQKKKT